MSERKRLRRRLPEEAGEVPEDVSEEAGTPVAPGSESSPPLNGFGVSDWMVLPLLELGEVGLEFLDRTDVPPKLVPYAGRRVAKLKKPQRDEILRGLGRHQRFTEKCFDAFKRTFVMELKAWEGRSISDMFAAVDEETEDPEILVSVLLCQGRPDDAAELAGMIEGEEAGEEEPAEEGDLRTLVEELLIRLGLKQKDLDRTHRQLEDQVRHSKKAEKALESERAAARKNRRAKDQALMEAGRAREKLDLIQGQRDGHLQEIARLKTDAEDARRAIRDREAEIRHLQTRNQRLRKDLAETRAKLPPEPAPPLPVLRAPDPPPSLRELGARKSEGGPHKVLAAKRLLLIVDGCNVALSCAGGETFEDKRRFLEASLQTYQARTANEVLVVYDGRKTEWMWVPTVNRKLISVCFTTEGFSADDYIVDELALGVDGHTPVVATSDGELRRRCIERRAFVLSSQELATAISL